MFRKECMTIETTMFITYGKGGKIFSSDFSPFWLWFSKKDLTIIKVLEIVNFTPFYYMARQS